MTLYLTPTQAMDRYLRCADGTYLISKASFLRLCHDGIIPSTNLGMARRIYVPIAVCEKFWGAASISNTEAQNG